MILNLVREISVRGAVFEHGSLILLRRRNKNNFIFLTKRFDSIIEIIHKYRFNCSKIQDLVDFVNGDKFRCDLIEFVVDNVEDRTVLKLNFYEVKTRRFDSRRKYFETCLSNHKFMTNVLNFNAGTFLIGLILFEDWRFSFNVNNYSETFIRVYNSVENKTVFFTRPPENKELHSYD